LKIAHIKTLLTCGNYAGSKEWKATRERIHEAIEAVDWPEGAGTFTPGLSRSPKVFAEPPISKEALTAQELMTTYLGSRR